MQKSGVHALAPAGQVNPGAGMPMTSGMAGGLQKSRTMLYLLGAVVVLGGGAAWYILSRPALPPGFAGGNGRLEANQVFVAAKYPGRVKDVLFNEGDTVETGQVVARIDTAPLEAQLREAQAQIRAAEDGRRV